MRYSIRHKGNVHNSDRWVVKFDTIEECTEWLATHQNPIDYVVVDTETDVWFDGYTLTNSQVGRCSLFSYSLA